LIYFVSLAPHHCGFESQQGSLIPSCEEAIHLGNGMPMVLLGCSFRCLEGHLKSSSAVKWPPYDL
jgi:hypothetical protein